VSAAPRVTLVVHGRLWDGAPLAHDALAIAAGRIADVGATAALRERWRALVEREVDAAGATVTPGLIDAHLHLLPWARAADDVALAGAAQRADAVARVARFLGERPGAWPVVGRGWEASRWREAPHRAALDAVSGDRPVLLHSHDFHALWVNGAALRAAGIDARTAAPPGGVIERDAAGEATGVLRENAVRLCAELERDAARAAGSDAERLAAAARALHAFGITAVHDFERGADAFRAMHAFATGPGPRVRVLQCLGETQLDGAIALGIASGVGDDAFRVGALKLFADGTLGSSTAAMLEPYEGSTSRGLETLEPKRMNELVRRASESGIAVAIHAIGDRAVRNALDAFEAAGPARARPRLASRIEHAQLVDEADLARFAALGIVASMQPIHCTSDARLARERWGARCAGAYPWRTLLERGATLAFGSDAPVESPHPGSGLAAAVTRRAADGVPFEPRQRLTLDEALAAFTRVPAALSGAAGRLGTLAPGAHADLVVWDRDLHREAPERLHEARASCTVFAGEWVHGAAAAVPARGAGTGP